MTTKYSKDHEWVRVEGDLAVIGLTDHAQGQLGDVVFVELPAVGRQVKAHEACAVVESVKAASDVYSPVSGEVMEINEALGDNTALVNEAAESKAWFFKVKMAHKADLDKLMDRAAYDAFCKSGT